MSGNNDNFGLLSMGVPSLLNIKYPLALCNVFVIACEACVPPCELVFVIFKLFGNQTHKQRRNWQCYISGGFVTQPQSQTLLGANGCLAFPQGQGNRVCGGSTATSRKWLFRHNFIAEVFLEFGFVCHLGAWLWCFALGVVCLFAWLWVFARLWRCCRNTRELNPP